MYSIICYNDNKKLISEMYNYLSNDLNMIKKDKTIQSYLLVYNNKIFGIFSFKTTTNSITIVLLKIVNILDKYIKEFIYKIINNIIVDFDNIYIYQEKILPLRILIDELKVLDNYIFVNSFIENNNMILYYKKKHSYSYFNCLFY